MGICPGVVLGHLGCSRPGRVCANLGCGIRRFLRLLGPGRDGRVGFFDRDWILADIVRDSVFDCIRVLDRFQIINFFFDFFKGSLVGRCKHIISRLVSPINLECFADFCVTVFSSSGKSPNIQVIVGLQKNIRDNGHSISHIYVNRPSKNIVAEMHL